MKRTAKRKFEAEPAHEEGHDQFTPMEDLTQMLLMGWGETPQLLIPDNWREVQGPNPWPSPFVVSSPWRKRGKR